MAQLSPERIIEVWLGFWSSKVLLSAVELEVFTELAKEPADLSSLQNRLVLHPRGSCDFLDTLVALKFLERDGGVYRNTPTTDIYLDKNKPSYVDGILEMTNRRLYQHWGHLTEALRTGENQNEAKHAGDDPFTALYADAEKLKGFLHAMSG